MDRVAVRTGISASEFLLWEREQPVRHEYWHGEIFAMAGGTPRHAALSSRIARALGSQLAGRCEVFSSDLQIGVGGEKYVYADVTVVCGPAKVQEGTKDVIENPKVVVEVLSKNTEQYDRGGKWAAYQRLASLTDYVLVSQTTPRIELFSRAESGAWVYRQADAGGRIVLSDGCVLTVDEIFAGAFDLPGE